MARRSSGPMIRSQICSMSSRQRAPGTYANGTGILLRMAGVQLKVDGRSHR